MIPNNSPWIKQLNRTRSVVPLDRDIKTDLAIVGGGIAGIMTAYFTLRDTTLNVVLIEADKVAHGATGHNAGQITSYFERPLAELVEEFGLKLAIDGQRAVESGWMLLDEIYAQAKLQTPIYRFTGYAGCSTLEQLIAHLRDNLFRMQGGLPLEAIIVSEEFDKSNEIPSEYADLYETASQKDILSLLETENQNYVASIAYQKGCMNSALFCEEVLGYLSAKFSDRFQFFEGSPMKTVRLKDHNVSLEILGRAVVADKVILCTNGFSNFQIINEAGSDINTEFHHLLRGRIGYMAGYIEASNSPPTSISYFPKNKKESSDPTGEAYFYLTRRPHEHTSKQSFNLLCAGGPEKVLPNQAVYSKEDACSEDIWLIIDDFLSQNYRHHPDGDREYAFCWHGLMGYTPNGVRRIGPEPCNQRLLYNLGCNGVGILPSIYGGKKISQFLNEEKMEASIFDPVHSE